MSTGAGPSPPPLPPLLPPPHKRNGCADAMMVTVGIVLLLPGLCALIFGLGTPSTLTSPLVLLGLSVGCLGLVLLWLADRQGRS
jgi:hypothetical protein